MKILIAEDDFTSRLLMQEYLKSFGLARIAVNGREAVEVFREALETGQPYDLVCLDIMMPGMDGQQALREIRSMEKLKGISSTKGAKIVMTSALDDIQDKIKAFSGLCDDYLMKPIDKGRLLIVIRDMKLIP